jgi:hypothetical protein
MASAGPEFEDAAPAESGNGAVLLSWAEPSEHDDPAVREFELQEAGDPSFVDPVTCYRGRFPSFFVSGRRDGTRYFRVRSRPASASASASAWSSWSATKVVVVEHHDLTLALALFGAGAVVFAATCLTLILGARSQDPGRGEQA